MLYQREAFEALTGTPWNEERVRRSIRELVADTDAALRGPKLLWRAHEWDRWHATSPMKQLYVGSAGVLWGLDALRRRGHAETTLDLADLAVRNLERFRERPDYIDWHVPEPRDSALFLGEAGIVLVAWRLAPSTELADRLHALVRANVENPAEEVFWGAPGTLMVARAMLAWTGEERWRKAADETAEALLRRRGADGLWVQRLYGQEMTSLTPPHGVVGIVQALVPVLDQKRGRSLQRDTGAILERTAVIENGAANWPPRPRPELPGPDGQVRLQWCAGAPGIVIGASEYLDEELLLAGAELVWRAGPHGMEKGACICHGTAGNGYAFLKAFARTGDDVWLDRARRFAVHALEQVERARDERGRGRYSLFTGDIGAALFAADCLDSKTGYPIFDSLDW